MDLEELWADLATELLDSLIAYRARVSELDVQEKPDHTLLTEADLTVEALIINKIRAWDPDAKVVAEESGTGSWRPGEGDEPERIWAHPSSPRHSPKPEGDQVLATRS
jgi:3'(2'), 5'-bisphosphate nucleotidase